MSQREPRASSTGRGWAVVGLGAVAVMGLVAGIWLATNGPPESGADRASSPSVTAPGRTSSAPTAASTTGPASAVALFPVDEVLFADTSRDVSVDPAGAWPLGACPAPAPEPSRVDFVSGTEHGPEYARDLAMGWYADDASAHDAYGSVWAAIQACAANTGATVATAPAELGAEGQTATIAQPAADGEAEVSIYVLARIDGVLVMAVDHASFLSASVPAPADASGTRAQADRLITELARRLSLRSPAASGGAFEVRAPRAAHTTTTGPPAPPLT